MSSSFQNSLWIVAVADRGIIAHVHAYNNEADATKDLADYLRQNHTYDGKPDLTTIYKWLRLHDEYLAVEIICQDGLATKPVKDHVEQFIKDGGFIVIGKNAQDPDPRMPYEAWGYKGPLDFESAAAITFGLVAHYSQALWALNMRLADCSDKKTSSAQ